MSFLFDRQALVLIAVMALFAAASATWAQTLESQFSYQIVEYNAEGQEQLITRDSVKPGELIHYQLSHANMTQDAMAGLVIAAPVPQGVTITIDGQSSSVPATFEVQAELDPTQDGLEWSTLPAMRKVIDGRGVVQDEPLPASAIVAVRWRYANTLEPGETAFNSYRVRVN
ncbi:hypothetical protein BFP70_10540 [Thioclava sp. SK-1]|uniref:hypothetical protein n=1 Tax=Thioclava sp. SK-1 TaxID=1889770 RepID=UPI00082658DE|nr:hypothetical protein [Thioclava sp. SK-1]OCX64481.1 hypothetical protein BFP70_10540 [Thioclava sp. SK-1]